MWEKLSDFDKGWVTGMIEGEGYIGARKTKRGATELELQITSTDSDTIARLESLVGGKIYGPYPASKHAKKKNWKPCYSWRLYKKAEVREILDAVYPTLSQHRKQQVDGAYLKYETRTTQRGGDLSRYRRKKPSAD